MANNKYSWENESDKILKRLASQENEEFLSKKRAKELFDNGILKNIQVGTFEGLKEIHRYLFKNVMGLREKCGNMILGKVIPCFVVRCILKII